jgi:hypothetical protein
MIKPRIKFDPRLWFIGAIVNKYQQGIRNTDQFKNRYQIHLVIIPTIAIYFDI